MIWLLLLELSKAFAMSQQDFSAISILTQLKAKGFLHAV
jgi:hypothetical protein